MNKVLALCLLMWLWADSSHAVTRYVIPGAGATGCSNGSTNYNPATNTCGAGSDLVYTSHANVTAAMLSCDVAIYRAGSYDGQAFISNAQANAKSGTSACYTTFRGYHENAETAILTGVSATPTLMAFMTDGTEDTPVRYIEVSHFEFNFTATGNVGGCWYMRGINHHHRFTDNVCHDGATGILMKQSNTGVVGDHYIARNQFYRMGLLTNLDPPGKNVIYGMGNRTIAEDNLVHDVCNGFSIYASVSGTSQNNVVIRRNIFYNVGRRDLYAGMAGMQCQTAIAQPAQGSAPLIHNNIIYDSFTLSTDVAIRVYLSYSGTNARIYNNTIYNTTGKGISVETGTGGVVSNNIVYQTTGTPVSITGGTGSASNNLSTDPSFIAVGSDNYTLAAGSAAIGAGTEVGLPFNGAAPDIGAHETFGFSSGTIEGSTAEIVLGMNLHTPVQPTIAGWTLTCTPNPTACFAATITGATLKPGASATILITFTGGNPAAGQDWTVTYAPASGATTDLANIGGVGASSNQELSAITTQALTNNGSGVPAPPVNPHIHYKFDEGTGTNANDETVNNLDCTLTNSAGWGTGLTGSGLLLTPGTTQHCAIAYGNAVNPTVTSLTVSFWGKMSSEGFLFGPNNGTNQRFLIAVSSGTARLGIQGSNTGTASEFSVALGDWTHFCVTLDKDTPGAGTGTAILHVNGTAGSSAGAIKTYTSYVFASNWRLGNADINPSPGVQIDNFKTWTSVLSCSDEYLSSNPPASPWSGNLASVAFRFYSAKYDTASIAIPLALAGTSITVPEGGAVTIAVQTDGTVSDPTAIAEKLYYHCALCPSADAYLAVPNTATTDGVEFWGVLNESGLLTGDHGAPLSGALTYVAGATNLTADSVPVIDLAQDNSTVMRWIVRIVTGTAQGRVFCFTTREQTGAALNSSVEGCVTVGHATAYGGP